MKWYGVKSVVYEDGSVTAKMDTQISPVKPQDTKIEKETYDIYVEWFDDKATAIDFIRETANISTEAKRANQIAKMHDLSHQMAMLIQEMEETS